MDTPKLGPQRIESLDVIRGVAVCGLIPINILDFAPAGDLYLGPADLAGFELWLWQFVNLMGSGKFMSLFALLFGAGIVLATEEADAARQPVAKRYLRRLGWLMFFGMIHAYLVWHGDILVGYAITGFVVFWCRKWTIRTQVIAGVAMLAVFSALIGLIALVISVADIDLGNLSDFQDMVDEETEKELKAFQGSWLEQTPQRALTAVFIQAFGIPLFIFWIAGGMMFLGMALMKSGFFRGQWKGRRYRTLGIAGIAGGILLSGAGALLINHHREGNLGLLLFHYQWSYWGTFILAIGYAACLMLWCRGTRAPWLRRTFAAAGRMAFSNYLGQSIILGLIFYGHGLGLKGQLSFTQIMAVVPCVWVFQLTFSVLWLKRFRFGPMEWLWRSLTYGKRIAIRRTDR